MHLGEAAWSCGIYKPNRILLGGEGRRAIRAFLDPCIKDPAGTYNHSNDGDVCDMSLYSAMGAPKIDGVRTWEKVTENYSKCGVVAFRLSAPTGFLLSA